MWQYFSTDGFYEIPIGNSTFDMPAVDDLRGGMSGFPDRASVEKLRYYGIRTVVLHTQRFKHLPVSHSFVVPEPPDPPPRRPSRSPGLGITRRRVGSMVIYEIGPGPKALHGTRLMLSSKRLALAAILLVGLAYATMIQSFSWNQTSHYDLIRSLDKDGTTIDAYQENTGDKAFYKGHWYSARAPGLALFALPFYDTLNLVNADSWARKSEAQRGDDEMIYLIGLWANVLPGLLLLLLVWRVAERFEPGYGALAAVALGLGTMVLPLSTLLFSHVFTAFLGFAAFALMLRERDGPPSPMLLALAGLAMGYAVVSEYPLFFVAARARALPALAPRRLHAARRRCAAPAPTSPAAIVGHRAAAPLQPLRLPLLDAPRLLRRAAPAQRVLRDRPAQPEGARDAAVRLARPAHAVARAADGRDRHRAAATNAGSAPRH